MPRTKNNNNHNFLMENISIKWKSNTYELFIGKSEYMKTTVLTMWSHYVMPGNASNAQEVLHTSHLKQHFWAGCKNNYALLIEELSVMHLVLSKRKFTCKSHIGSCV